MASDGNSLLQNKNEAGGEKYNNDIWKKKFWTYGGCYGTTSYFEKLGARLTPPLHQPSSNMYRGPRENTKVPAHTL